MNYSEIGHQSLEAFVHSVQRVILYSNEFDHIVAASDSGNLAAHITKEVYASVNKIPPAQFTAPIFRHVDKERTIVFDNSVLKGSYEQWQGKDFGQVLFVDDEIWRANTLNGMLDLLFALDINIGSCTIIAEDGGFVWSPIMRGIPTKFISPRQRLPEVYNAFSYIVPLKFQTPVREALRSETVLNDKQIMCTLLNLPVKARDNGMPYFSDRLISDAKRGISGFVELQYEFSLWLQGMIRGYASDRRGRN